MGFGEFFESVRDRVVHRSLIGKRKLDRSATRRQLDIVLRDLGERYRGLAAAGQVAVPEELAEIMEQVRDLEDRLESHDRELDDLQRERTSTT